MQLAYSKISETKDSLPQLPILDLKVGLQHSRPWVSLHVGT